MSVQNSFDFLPYFAQGTVVKGFGRGSSELGMPTANFPDRVISELPETFACGVYYGWACLNTLCPTSVYKMVMCVGWNPHFHNTVKTMETHIIHKFDKSFYGENLRIVVVGYVRPMRAFNSVDELIAAMQEDVRCAESSLDQPQNASFKCHPFLVASSSLNEHTPFPVNAILTSTGWTVSSTETHRCHAQINTGVGSIRRDGNSTHSCKESNQSSSDGHQSKTSCDNNDRHKIESSCDRGIESTSSNDLDSSSDYTFMQTGAAFTTGNCNNNRILVSHTYGSDSVVTSLSEAKSC